MLPFLKPKRVAGLIISQRKPDGSNEAQHEEGDEMNEMEVCAEEILRAISSKDAKALASALQAAMDISASQPEQPSEEDTE
jgi:hypothetical protein